MSLVKDGWFSERGELWPGQAMSLEIDEILHHSQSDFQDILVFRSKTYGVVLVLDGVIQCTERDEFAYQEMIAHLPLHCHTNVRDVLIIGGGDGGVVREVLKHSSVESVTLCEIDPCVVQVAKEFLPSMSSSLSDKRVKIVHADGSKFLKEHLAAYDVIITDSSDPIGPAETLFQPTFFEAVCKSLRSEGILCTQGECMWLHAQLIKPLLDACRQLFPVVEYAYTTIPTYPSGQIGFVICAKRDDIDVKNPVRSPTEMMINTLQYYNTDIHKAAFVLPQFAKRQLG